MDQRIYLDYNATAKIRPEVIDALAAVMATVGNASSVHGAGREARKSVETARKQVAMLVGAVPEQVVFTSGGTEADNQVMGPCDPAHTFVSDIEHPAVLDACPGAHRVPVNCDGVIDLGEIASPAHSHGHEVVRVRVGRAIDQTDLSLSDPLTVRCGLSLQVRTT